MAKSDLEKLPPEIQTIVIKSVQSTNALHSLICASPRYYHIFVLSKDSILFELVRNVISPEAFPEALVVASGAQEAPRGLASQCINALLDEYAEYRRQANMNSWLPPSKSIPLLKLNNSIDYHLERFEDFTLGRLKNCTGTLIPGSEALVHGSETSKMEFTRLQRAFYRLELYCRLFHSSENPGSNAPSHKQVSSGYQEAVFLFRFPPWEVEEISTVWHYLRNKVGRVFRAVEDDFVRATFQHLGDRNILDKENWDALMKEAYADSKKYHRNNESVNISHMDDILLGGATDFFRTQAKRFSHDKHIEYICSMGLAFLQKLFEASPEQQRQLVLSNTCTRSSVKFLTSALNVYSDNATQRHAAPPGDIINIDDPYSNPNEGFQWASEQLSPSFPCRHKGGLRSLGYVFWDTPRIRGICSMPIKTIADMCQGAKLGRWKTQPSAELRIQRLCDTIYRTPMRRNVRSFFES